MNTYEQFKTNYRFIVHSKSVMPHEIRQPHSVNLFHLDFILKKLLEEIAILTAFLNDESIWAAEINSYLKKLSLTVLSASNVLDKVQFDDENFIENQNPRYRDYQYYFKIKESQGIDFLQFVAQDIRLFYLLILEMSEIRMDDAEIRHFLAGAQIRFENYRALLAQLVKSDSDGSFDTIDEDITSAVVPRESKISTAFFRWINGHYDFAQNIIHAKYQLDNAIKYYDEENEANAASSVTKAGELMRASTSSMVFASMIPPKIYQEYIRPSMGLGFTGVDNPQWAAFAASRKILLSKVKGTNSAALLHGLKILFEKFLQDIEVHTGIADKMIGNGVSLTVKEINAYLADSDKNTRSATADLRNLHYIRLKEFEFLNLYPILNKLFQKNTNGE